MVAFIGKIFINMIYFNKKLCKLKYLRQFDFLKGILYDRYK